MQEGRTQQEWDEHWMRQALAQAAASMQLGEVPVGAVLVRDNSLLGEAHNDPIQRQDPTAHAEMRLLQEAAREQRNYRLPETTLYVTLEPCPMCAGAMVHARVRRLVFGARDLRFGGVRSKFRIADSELLNHRVEVCEGILAADCVRLLQEFFGKRR